MGLFIGIDGGGTGCRAIVADASGQVLARSEAGPANIASDPEGALQNILLCAEAAFRTAVGAGAEAAMRTAQAGLGLAGANALGAAETLAAGLPFRTIRIETDALAAARGALGRDDGILAALGTGSVFVRQVAGVPRQFGGWGLILGDEGSGARLGRSALTLAMRAQEGMADATPFLTDLVARHGGPEGVIAFSIAARPTDFGKLAPEIIGSPDPACLALWQDSVADVTRILEALQPPVPLPVTFIGGLGAATAQALTRFPQRAAQGGALDGALMLARMGA